MKTITRKDLAERVKILTQLSQAESAAVIDHLIDTVREALSEGHRIELRGLFTLVPITRKAKMGRNPQQPQKMVSIPERRSIKLRLSKELKNSLQPAN